MSANHLHLEEEIMNLLQKFRRWRRARMHETLWSYFLSGVRLCHLPVLDKNPDHRLHRAYRWAVMRGERAEMTLCRQK